MVIVMKPSASQSEIKEIEKVLEKSGLGVHISTGQERTIIGVIGDKRIIADMPIEMMPGVDRVIPIVESFKLASKTFKPEPTTIRIKDIEIGGKSIVIIAGPCAVENHRQLMDTARGVKAAGARFLRGGAYKPRTSPYSFQGLEEEGLKMLAEAREETELLIVSEVVSVSSIDTALKYVDVIQIGARNMQNFQLLRELGRAGVPVLLKRGIAATVEEWLNAAEYIMSEGNYRIILCERGIRTFETSTRNTLDISAIPVVKHLSHLPIIVDPSHGTGKWQLVEPMSRAAIAAGADGLMIEVHPTPQCALSDGPQSLNIERFSALTRQIQEIARVIGRTFP
ncbi:MAG: 3-deoxy-7-phosphoheptulonate synthase [Clostridia bacterium]